MEPPGMTERWQVIARHGERLKRTLAARLGERTDDAVQEAMVRATQSRPEPASAALRAWLARVATNLAIDWWRRERRQGTIDLARHLEAEPSPVVERVDLERALGRLSRTDRELLLALASGFTYRDLAEREGATVEAIRQRVARARARLLIQMEEPA
jgi:RNA polymerase sigma-70 factor (ECF subfamily)